MMLDGIKHKLIQTTEALDFLEPNQRIVTSMAVAEPKFFFESLSRKAPDLKNTIVYCANPASAYDCFTDTSLGEYLELQVMFLTDSIRKNQGHNLVHYIPQHLSNWARNIHRQGPVDIFWGSCTSPDSRGFVNLGPSACYEHEILRKAKKVILEINPNLPTTNGTTHVPISWVDHFIENKHELTTIPRSKVTKIDEEIAKFVAELVKDESTLQLGIGAIPNAIGKALEFKKDLGIHTEMINDTIMDLYNVGAITGKAKTIWPGQIVGSFALGSLELYKFLHQNPIIELEASSVVNDPYRMGRNHRMVSINTAVELDLTGQVCSESVGHRELSGVGGATDTHIGAQRSKDGRGIIAIHSTTKNEELSKIVFELKPGAKVSISRNDIDTIVTEFGVAELLGRSVAQRAKALISIAHPKFRDELLFNAKKYKYV